MIKQSDNAPLNESVSNTEQLLAAVVLVLRAMGWALGVPAGLLIAAVIMGHAPRFMTNASLLSFRYMGVVQLGVFACHMVFLTRKDDLQAGYDILSIISATVCACAATAYFLG